MSAAGSPGSRCKSRNTPIVARTTTGMACASRCAMKTIMPIPAATPRRLAYDQVGESSQALGDQLRVFDMADRMTDHARYQDLALGELHVLPDRPLPIVARIGRLDRKPLGIYLQNQ